MTMIDWQNLDKVDIICIIMLAFIVIAFFCACKINKDEDDYFDSFGGMA